MLAKESVGMMAANSSRGKKGEACSVPVPESEVVDALVVTENCNRQIHLADFQRKLLGSLASREIE